MDDLGLSIQIVYPNILDFAVARPGGQQDQRSDLARSHDRMAQRQIAAERVSHQNHFVTYLFDHALEMG